MKCCGMLYCAEVFDLIWYDMIKEGGGAIKESLKYRFPWGYYGLLHLLHSSVYREGTNVLLNTY